MHHHDNPLCTKYLPTDIGHQPLTPFYPASPTRRITRQTSFDPLFLAFPNALTTIFIGVNALDESGTRYVHIRYPRYWGDLHVDLFPKATEETLVLHEITKDTLLGFLNGLRVMGITVDLGSDDWILQHLPQIKKILEKSLRFDNAEYKRVFNRCLRGFFKPFPLLG
ncbi:hypothetical protein HOY80DRAFT_1034520 [Tuber brumale]|nr:hypothetical protein HOY80DRAFT_1034520 [Tuber brumale]